MDVEEQMDPVNKKELKGTHAQRKDKDINNDGKVDRTDKYLHARRKAITKNISKKKDETASMNPKLSINREKGSEMEQKESTIREKLMAVLEGDRSKHYKGATAPEDMDNNLKGAGAKKMKADIQGNAANPDLEKQSHDDAAKAGRVTKDAKKRSNDNPKGDKKIINPPEDITKKGQGASEVKESRDKLAGIKAAYASMYETVSSGNAQHNLEDDERKAHADYMKKKHGVTTKFHGSDELSYHGPKANVKKALGTHYGGDHDHAKEEHPHIFKEGVIGDFLAKREIKTSLKKQHDFHTDRIKHHNNESDKKEKAKSKAFQSYHKDKADAHRIARDHIANALAAHNKGDHKARNAHIANWKSHTKKSEIARDPSQASYGARG